MVGLRGLASRGAGLARSAWASPYGKGAIAGASLGGVYGAFSDQTSILGGALKGATLGAGIVAGGRAGYAGLGMYRMGRFAGMGKGKAAWQAMAGLGRGAGTFIGNTAGRAVNGFKAMGSVGAWSRM